MGKDIGKFTRGCDELIRGEGNPEKVGGEHD